MATNKSTAEEKRESRARACMVSACLHIPARTHARMYMCLCTSVHGACVQQDRTGQQLLRTSTCRGGSVPVVANFFLMYSLAIRSYSPTVYFLAGHTWQSVQRVATN